MSEDSVKKLEKQMKALEERLKLAKAREAHKERKAKNKRRFLLGAMLEAWMDEDADIKDAAWKRLDAFLTRESDRRYFGFGPKGPKNDGAGDK